MTRFLSETNKQFIKEHPEKRKEFSERLTRTLARLWQNPEYQARMRENIIKGNKNHTTNKTGKLKFLTVSQAVMRRYGTLSAEDYAEFRKELYPSGAAPHWTTGLQKYFQNDPDLVRQEINGNHRVICVKKIVEREDVYDLTIDGSHNFALASGVFVHNSVDGDPAAAMRYCVTGDTLVVTDRGLVPIEKISEHGDEEVAIGVLSKDRNIHKADKWFDSGEHPTLKITTQSGLTIQGPYNHPILTWSRSAVTGKPNYRWKLLSQLNEGDVAVIDRTPTFFGL